MSAAGEAARHPGPLLAGASRIAVIGSPGSGKSYLATRIATLTSLPLYRLDDLYWQADWTRTAAEVWRETVTRLAGRETWIIDGNYGPTLAIRLRSADLVVFIDRATMPCLITVLHRILGWVCGRRTGLPARVATGRRRVPAPRDLGHFLWLVASFRRRVRPAMLKLMGEPDAAPCVRLSGRSAVNEFLRNERTLRG